ncbi:MAG: ribose 5-phosphate isomerase B [Armatimonadetes bacterium]|nr:ribose 5-phosphate isomerase B [Armatimonadota bacterium]MCX7967281.1 ribose 5-phosphate isomerase B [Armatimonadota bacterium]MDW8141911.1 ribose 5-phosphate isomerase B [Armatimonadota bacterium]
MPNFRLPRRIALGSDHAGFELKEWLKERLEEAGYECQDFGTHVPQSCDYPDFSVAVAHAVASGEFDTGIVICGTGIGSSIAANKIPGIRCALCWNEYTARMARTHNDANVLALGARVIGNELAWEIVKVWLETPFSGEERHRRRLEKISTLESLNPKDCLGG